VIAASGVHRGDRLVGVPLGRVADRIRRVPSVAAVRVSRSWPGTVSIRVVERVPVAASPATGGGFVLVDATGVEAGLATDLPAQIVRFEVDPLAPAPGSRLPATFDPLVTVAASVPSAANGRLLTLRPAAAGAGTSASEVDGTVRLPGGATATVRFGPPDQLPRKWLALLTILDGADLARVATIDVRVPSSPAITRR
jgi:cell division protein FtsQ